VKKKVVPSSRKSAQAFPPSDVIVSRTMLSPSPVPAIVLCSRVGAEKALEEIAAFVFGNA
jgi:hypothetical protein